MVSYKDIAGKHYSFSAGQYFEVRLEYSELTPDQFTQKMLGYKESLNSYFEESRTLEKEIQKQLTGLNYE